MRAYDKLKTVRQSGRPTAAEYIEQLFTDRISLSGDRRFGDDTAIQGGIGFLEGIPVTYIAIEKGKDLNERIQNHFGCPKPEGYRKALRLMKEAEKFHRPVICIVDTQGAYCGAEAEERGQGQAIAENILEMMGLETPTISIVIGEGGSGGALALCTTDYVYMLENACYSVISPEGCASILWKDASKADEAADALQITAQDMKRMGVAETVISEDFKHFKNMCRDIKKQLVGDLQGLMSCSTTKLLSQRYDRFRKYGVYEEGGVVHGALG
ncbi:MAG: acetyl-CoA carboxylase carboxyl transferase subunit alpha [Firmicutes bacterium]|nr:acetyl-CoA carboxylase carboxyl transferase subunit alpha [Bacillota bacterium]